MSERKGDSWSKAFYRGFLDGLAAPTFLWDTPRRSRRYAERDGRTGRVADVARQAFDGISHEFGAKGADGGVKPGPFRKAAK